MNSLRLNPIVLLLLVFILSLAISPASGATLCVNQAGTGGCATTIQAAVNSSHSGDTITVAPGIYTGTVTIPAKADLTINGAGPGVTEMNGNFQGNVLLVGKSASLTLNNLSIKFGGQTVLQGAGIMAAGVTMLSVTGVLFEANTVGASGGTAQGGAIFFTGGKLNIDSCEFTFNSAAGMNGFGGAIYASGAVSITRSTFDSNNASLEGGAIYFVGNGKKPRKRPSVKSGPKALTLIDSTLWGNFAGNAGGGIFNTKGILFLNDDTLTANEASLEGGGIETDGPAKGAITSMSNTILALNGAPAAIDCAGKGGNTLSAGYNLIGDTAGCALTTMSTDIVGADPIFDTNLRDNGGATLTLAILSGSPAIDAGNPATDNGAGNHCTAEDQRGNERVGRCDIGAYEFP